MFLETIEIGSINSSQKIVETGNYNNFIKLFQLQYHLLHEFTSVSTVETENKEGCSYYFFDLVVKLNIQSMGKKDVFFFMLINPGTRSIE
jgi:hypothetical protein